jgi:hypothetical protein
MTTSNSAHTPEPGPDSELADIQGDIERTRHELGETVGALSDKLDVKKQVHQQADHTKQRLVDGVHTAQEKATQNPAIPAAVAVAVAALVALVIWRRRR